VKLSKKRGEYTYSEIMGAPDALQAAVARADGCKEDVRRLLDEGYEEVVFVGCGSSLYLSEAAAAFYRHALGVNAMAVAASELALYIGVYFPNRRRTLLVAFSRSGETSETLAAVEAFRRQGFGKIVAITCTPESRLAAEADIALAVPEADEKSMVMTKSFAGMLMAVEWAGASALKPELLKHLRGVPDAARESLARHEEAVERIGKRRELGRFAFLGAGPNYGVACEGMLKMTEMTRVPSSAFHPLEFRHGPKAAVDSSTAVVLLVSDTGRAWEAGLASELKALSAVGVVLAPGSAPEFSWDCVLEVGTGIPEVVRPLVYVLLLDLLGYYRAMELGLDPDVPANLSRAVLLEGMGT
jgi:glucosamine--fructose-6-phosphate aminotransferase (isomerizing)